MNASPKTASSRKSWISRLLKGVQALSQGEKPSKKRFTQLNLEHLERREMLSYVPGSARWSDDKTLVAWQDTQKINGQTLVRVCEGHGNYPKGAIDGWQVGGFHNSIVYLEFGPRSHHLGNVARDNSTGFSGWLDDKRLGTYHAGMSGLVFSPDGNHVAASVWGDRNGGGIWKDGQVWYITPSGYTASVGTPIWSNDSQHVACSMTYYTGTWSHARVFEDGRLVGGEHKEVKDLKFSPNSRHLGYIYSDFFTDGKTRSGVCVDGKNTGYHNQVANLYFTSNSRSFVFSAQDNGKWVTYVGGAE